MARTNKRPAEDRSPPSDEDRILLASEMISPGAMSAMTLATYMGDQKGNGPDASHMIDAVESRIASLNAGDVEQVEGMLLGQAISLQAMFMNLADRAAANMGKFPQATESYMRLALKAQAQSRATLEAIAKMKQPREQTVRHIHVGPQGQAVFIENLHGGYANARTDGQPHACGPALLGQNQEGNGVPISSDEKRAMQDAWREIAGRAEGEQECLEARGALSGNESSACGGEIVE